MRWTMWVGLAVALLGVSSCYYGYRAIYESAPYSMASRPHASYFCYDCHGYQFFDPYYDWCAAYGFRYAWAAHPQVVRIYRERYVRIREHHPEYGRYRYAPDYRASPRYRDERDYERWRSDRSGSAEPGPEMKERSRDAAPSEKEPHKKGHERKERRHPRDGRSDPGGREV